MTINFNHINPELLVQEHEQAFLLVFPVDKENIDLLTITVCLN